MRRRKSQAVPSALVLWSGLLALVLAACRQQAETPAAPAPISAAERGRALYERGLGASGQPVVALVGAGSIQVPATEMPCINCHGPDGRGRPEGGVAPSNLRWDSLTRPYEVAEGNGRRHPAYDARLFGRALALGVDSAGNELSDAMPRYQLAREDLANLIAHLQALGTQADPGFDEKEIRIGTVVPAQGDGQAVLPVLAAYFDEINRRGGIYGRRLILRSVEQASAEGHGEAVRRLLEEERPFALIHVALGDKEDGAARMLEAQQVPLVGARSLRPAAGSLRRRYIFYLYGGILEQARALVLSVATARVKNRRVVILQPPGDEARKEARSVMETCISAGLEPLEEHILEEGGAAALVPLLARKDPGVVLFLGSTVGLRELREKAARAGWSPLFLVPGGQLSEELAVSGPVGRLRVALPSSPEAQTPGALAEYRQLAEAYKLPGDHLSAQFSALAEAKILVEGLKRAGRDLSREALVRALEGMHDFQTGFTPPISYGKEQRLGARGAYVFELDAAGQRATPGWVRLPPEER